jgi:hypothetical protein
LQPTSVCLISSADSDGPMVLCYKTSLRCAKAGAHIVLLPPFVCVCAWRTGGQSDHNNAYGCWHVVLNARRYVALRILKFFVFAIHIRICT